MNLYTTLDQTIKKMLINEVSEDQKSILSVLVNFIQQKRANGEAINLNFICTHNSRRSQFAQLWAQTAAFYYGIEVNCFSGGVEETAFNKRAVDSVERSGFKVVKKNRTSGRLHQHGEGNPRYTVSFGEDAQPLVMFSKMFDDASNPSTNFAAVMTCSHADENCPFIPGTEARIPLLYNDPKEFDGTAQEAEKYDERSMQIATELFYVFSCISNVE